VRQGTAAIEYSFYAGITSLGNKPAENPVARNQRRNVFGIWCVNTYAAFTERMPACWSYVMTIGRIFGIFIFSSLAASGAALAGGTPKGAGSKIDHPVPTSEPASARHVIVQAPIVMGRSVTEHHKTKLHHIKMKPVELVETPAPTEKN
jgi:hypothetical protein